MTNGKNKSKMICAFWRFSPKTCQTTTSKSFERFVKATNKGMSGENNPFYGMKHTDESKAKFSGKNHGMYGKTRYDIWLTKYGKEEADRRELPAGNREEAPRTRNEDRTHERIHLAAGWRGQLQLGTVRVCGLGCGRRQHGIKHQAAPIVHREREARRR